MRFISGLRAAACLLTFACLSSTASGDCVFEAVQDEHVFSTHWNTVLFYNYTTGGSTVAPTVFGPRTASFEQTTGVWLGAFLYDYALQRFVQSKYSFTEPRM